MTSWVLSPDLCFTPAGDRHPPGSQVLAEPAQLILLECPSSKRLNCHRSKGKVVLRHLS